MDVRWLGFIAGLLLVLGAGVSLTKTLVVPRSIRSALSRVTERAVTWLFLKLANTFEEFERKDQVLVLQAPVILLVELLMWILLFGVGYGLMLWPLIEGGLDRALRVSGSSLLTLGFATSPQGSSIVVQFAAAATGLVVVALLIAYLPALYSAFNRRETLVTLLQSRAGAPAWGPEILARHQVVDLLDALPELYLRWEEWAADVAESHTNYPVLIHFRSPHPLRSWIVGLLAVLDSAALYLAMCPSTAPSQARLCLRMGFTCLRDVARTLDIPYDPDPMPDDPVALTYEEFEGGLHRMRDVGFPAERSPEEAWPQFRGWRVNYEAVAYAIADRVVAVPGPWAGERTHLPGMAIVPQRPLDRRPEDPTGKGASPIFGRRS